MPNQTQLTIEKLVYGGDSLARDGGRVVLTPFALPGEKVLADISRAKNDLFRGRLIEVLEPAPARVEPRCPYFFRCGGCHYQHAEYGLQIEQKCIILREVLRRVGKIDYQGEIQAISGEPWAYRNRAQFHIQDGAIGYFLAGTHELCPIDHCPISSPKINEAIAYLARELPQSRKFTGTVELFSNETDLQVNLHDRVPAAVLPLFLQVGTNASIDYGALRVSPGSFFQVNRFLIEQLVETAVGGETGEAAIDLYAGVGLFASRLVPSFSRVVAVEPGGSAFRDLEFNLHPRALLQQKTAEDYLTSLRSPPDLIVADPPRAGLGKLVTGELIRLRAPAVTVVSCDPATLARDLASLLGSGYVLRKINLVDLFPQTYHMEVVVRLALG